MIVFASVLVLLASSVAASNNDELIHIHHFPEVGNRSLVGGVRRAATNPCQSQLNRVNSCISSSCATCVNNALDEVLAKDPLYCSVFESDMCDAVYEDCTSLCGTCLDELEDLYECVALNSGCSSFECKVVPPTEPPTRPPLGPTCFDGIKNGDETGIDCGGSCTKQCATDPSPASCTMADFNQFCSSTMGTGARAACVMMGDQ